jgi:hypothetical protein
MGGVRFVTILWLDSLVAVPALAGENHEIAVVPPEASRLVSRFDPRLAHHKVVAAPVWGI